MNLTSCSFTKTRLLHWLTCNLCKIAEYYGIERTILEAEELHTSKQEDQLHQSLEQAESAIPVETEG